MRRRTVQAAAVWRVCASVSVVAALAALGGCVGVGGPNPETYAEAVRPLVDTVLARVVGAP